MGAASFPIGGQYQFTVPAQVTSLTFDVVGASGGGGLPAAASGGGARVQGSFPVTPGESILVTVGGRGDRGDGGVMGFNGGGFGGQSSAGIPGYAGGGATDIRQGGSGLAQRIVVAGGGGGGGGTNSNQATPTAGGSGGPATGQVGANGNYVYPNGTGGGGGTPTVGGAAGTPGGTATNNATAGSSGQGGSGSQHAATGFSAGGGGGGGYFGGGGGGGASSSPSGGYAGGGGGGSSFTAAAVTGVTSTRGGRPVNASSQYLDGTATLTWIDPPSSTPVATANADDTAGARVSWAYVSGGAADSGTVGFRWRVSASSAWTTVAGYASTSLGGAVRAYTYAADALAAYVGQSVEWQVQTQDVGGRVSAWSASTYFVPRAEPTTVPTVTTPGASFSSKTPSVVVANTTGFKYYRLSWASTADTGSTGWVAVPSGATVTTITARPTLNPTNGQVYTFTANTSLYTNNPVPSPGGTATSTAAVAAPSTPLITAITVNNATASLTLALSNPNKGTDSTPPVGNDVYRADLTAGAAEQRIASGVALDGSFTDWAAPLNRTLQYRVVAVAANGATTSST